MAEDIIPFPGFGLGLRKEHYAEVPLEPGMCVGFPANGTAHHLINQTGADV